MKLEFDLSFEFNYKDMVSQLRKIKEELMELEESILDKKYLRVINNGQIVSEAFDVIESCFTLLKYEYSFDIREMENAYMKHKIKLQEREVKNIEKK